METQEIEEAIELNEVLITKKPIQLFG